MQLKKIVGLSALAFAAISGQAQAASAISTAHQAIIDDAVQNGRVVFVSGASATQKGFNTIVTTLFSSPIRFASGTNYDAVAGVYTGAGEWNGANVIFIDRVKGGSIYGVNPVGRGQPIASIDLTNCTSGSGTSALPYACGETPDAAYMVPDAGISDVAPALFVAGNTEGEVAVEPLDDAQRADLTATPIYALAFGVPMTKSVPLATINRAALASIYAGNIGTWNVVNPAFGTDDVVICRRTPGSGTQAVNNLYFGAFPCSIDAAIPADRDSSGAWDADARKFTVTKGTGGVQVVENGSSGDVRKCLDAAEAGTSYTTTDRDGKTVNVEFVGSGHKAVGVLSMDSLDKSKSTGNWQFRSLDGAGTYTQASATATPAASGTGRFPTLANLIDGTWDMQGVISFNVPSRTTGAKAEVLAAFVTAAQDPALLSAQDALKHVTAGIAGSYDAANVQRVSYVGGNQCSALVRNQPVYVPPVQ